MNIEHVVNIIFKNRLRVIIIEYNVFSYTNNSKGNIVLVIEPWILIYDIPSKLDEIDITNQYPLDKLLK